MKSRITLLFVASAALAIPLVLVGCDREVSHTGSAEVNKDGSSKSKETVVTQSPNGTVTKEETSKKIDSDGDGSSKTKTTVRSPDGTVTKEETQKTTPAP